MSVRFDSFPSNSEGDLNLKKGMSHSSKNHPQIFDLVSFFSASADINNSVIIFSTVVFLRNLFLDFRN